MISSQRLNCARLDKPANRYWFWCCTSLHGCWRKSELCALQRFLSKKVHCFYADTMLFANNNINNKNRLFLAFLCLKCKHLRLCVCLCMCKTTLAAMFIFLSFGLDLIRFCGGLILFNAIIGLWTASAICFFSTTHLSLRDSSLLRASSSLWLNWQSIELKLLRARVHIWTLAPQAD